MSKKTKEKKLLPILVFLAFVLGSLWTYLVINQLDRGTVLTSGESKGSYTISENSIADAVDKIYDATVVVQTSKEGNIVSTGTGFVYKVNGLRRSYSKLLIYYPIYMVMFLSSDFEIKIKGKLDLSKLW